MRVALHRIERFTDFLGPLPRPELTNKRKLQSTHDTHSAGTHRSFVTDTVPHGA
jgi:hypothetical protein